MDLDAITLPAHTHAAGLWPDPAPPTGAEPDVLIIWADRPYRDCPQCAQPVPRDPGPPATLSTAGEITELPQLHTCGANLPIIWQLISPGPQTGEFSKRDIRRIPDQVLSQWKQQVTGTREYTRCELLRDLGVALSVLSSPDDPETGQTYESRAIDVTTGSATQPGIWHNGAAWCAWNYDPGSDNNDDRITVTGPDVVEHWKKIRAEINQ